jgi:predicted nucleic acid-binding protein
MAQPFFDANILLRHLLQGHPDHSPRATAFINHRLPFADAYHLVLMRQLNLTDTVTFDQEFDTVPGIRRLEP